MKYTLLVFAALLAFSYAAEELRKIQFSADRIEWLTVSQVEKLIVDPEVHFMDVTDFEYKDKYEVNAQPIPTTIRYKDFVTKAIASASVNNIKSTITTLAAYNTRYYRSTTGEAASNWLQNQYKFYANQYNRPDVKVVNFTYTAFPQASVIATIPGTGPNKNSYVVLGGHLDSVGSTTTGRSPGADDDASGSATVLEAFRALLAVGYKPDYTVQFMGYAAEEGGLLGSQGICADYQSKGYDVYAAVQFDMTGYAGTGSNAVPRIGVVTDFTSAELNTFIRLLIDTYSGLPRADKTCGYACSDHASWNRTGVRSAFPFEQSPTNPNIHSANDVLTHLNDAQMTGFMKLAIGACTELAGNPSA